MKTLLLIIGLLIAGPAFGQYKISNLPSASVGNDADIVEITQAGASKSLTLEKLRAIPSTKITDSGALGRTLLGLSNPSAVRFFRVDADNNISLLTVSDFKTALALVKADVGLGNVDNTADTAKPVSTPMQTALNDKAPTARNVATTNGLTGGGNLSADRTLALTGQALAVHNVSTNGIFVRTAPDTVVARSIAAGVGGKVAVTNGDGVSGNPTIQVADATAAQPGAIEIATDAETQTGADTTRAVVPSALAAWWTWAKLQATTFGTTSARVIFRLTGSNASNNSPLLSMFRSGTSEAVVSVQGGSAGNPIVFSLNPASNSDADLISAAKFSIGTNGVEMPGTMTVGGSVILNGTSNTAPAQTAATDAHLINRGLIAGETVYQQPVTIGITGAQLSASGTIAAFGVDRGIIRSQILNTATVGSYNRARVFTPLGALGSQVMNFGGQKVAISCWLSTVHDGDNTASSLFIGANDGKNLSSKGYGFRVSGNHLYAHIHDGTTETITDSTISNIGVTSGLHVVLVWDGLKTVNVYYAKVASGGAANSRPALGATVSSSANLTGAYTNGGLMDINTVIQSATVGADVIWYNPALQFLP